MTAQQNDLKPRPAAEAAPRISFLEKLRRERYLAHLTLWLDADTPSRELREARAQLRGDLDAAAADSSMRQALRDLGPARLLAAEYRRTLRPGPARLLWAEGACCLGAWLILVMVATAVFGAALWQVADEHGEASARLLWSEITVVNTDTAVAFGATGIEWTALVGLLAFVAGARIWRLVPALRPNRG